MIVVTGANGFIGSAVASELSRKFPGTEILAVDATLKEKHDLLLHHPEIRLIHSDELFAELETRAGEVEYVVHMGACSATTETDWDFLQKTNVEYTQRLFVWCAGRGVPFIYASSASVYGDGSLGFSDMDDPAAFEPLNLYGKSKVIVDRWALSQKQTPPQWYGLRFFNVFGPNEQYKGKMASVPFSAYGQIKETGKMKLFKSYNPQYKDGEQLRDFVYVKDITRWIVELMEKKPASGIYNMGYGTARTWLDLGNAMFDAMGLPRAIEFVEMPEHIRKHYQYFTEAPIEKLLSAGLSRPQWKLEEAIRDYIGEHLSQGNKLY